MTQEVDTRLLLDRIVAQLEAINHTLAQHTELLKVTALVSVEAPGVPYATQPAAFHKVTVVASGTPARGPAVPVPPGYDVIVRQRHHSGSPEGYVAYSSAEVGEDETRTVLHNNDSFGARVSNLNQFYFDADTATTNFELHVQLNPGSAVAIHRFLTRLIEGVPVGGAVNGANEMGITGIG